MTENEMTKILVIDTATEACSVALKTGTELYEDYQLAPRQHGELVLPMVDNLLKQANLKLENLDAIGFGRGPGAFTGLRICVSIVQGLAFGANLPVVGISSLQALAQQAYNLFAYDKVLAAIDARMNEIYWGQYELDNGLMRLVGEEQVLQPQDVTLSAADMSKDMSFYATGSGWKTYSLQLTEALNCTLNIEQEVSFPRASVILPIAEAEFKAGNAVAAELAQPVYLRNNVAKKKVEQGK